MLTKNSSSLENETIRDYVRTRYDAVPEQAGTDCGCGPACCTTAVKSRVRRRRAMLKKKLQDCCGLEFDRLGKIFGYEKREQRNRATAEGCRVTTT